MGNAAALLLALLMIIVAFVHVRRDSAKEKY
jgi:hypothetical protein